MQGLSRQVVVVVVFENDDCPPMRKRNVTLYELPPRNPPVKLQRGSLGSCNMDPGATHCAGM